MSTITVWLAVKNRLIRSSCRSMSPSAIFVLNFTVLSRWFFAKFSRRSLCALRLCWYNIFFTSIILHTTGLFFVSTKTRSRSFSLAIPMALRLGIGPDSFPCSLSTCTSLNWMSSLHTIFLPLLFALNCRMCWYDDAYNAPTFKPILVWLGLKNDTCSAHFGRWVWKRCDVLVKKLRCPLTEHFLMCPCKPPPKIRVRGSVIMERIRCMSLYRTTLAAGSSFWRCSLAATIECLHGTIEWEKWKSLAYHYY